MATQDLTGQKFNRLTVVRFDGYRLGSPDAKYRSKYPMWKCQCECGAELTVFANNLRSGHTGSCGCYRDDLATAQSTTHGDSNSPLYWVWRGMVQRCSDPNSGRYYRYGARGIRVEWPDYETFKKDMEATYAPGLEIERVDNDGNYAPGNCCWKTHAEQMKNMSSNVVLELDGRKQIMSDWARESGLKKQTLCRRLRLGWSVRDAITKPVRKR